MMTDALEEYYRKQARDEEAAFLLIPWEEPLEGYIPDNPPFTYAGDDNDRPS